jgi:ProP effector
MTGIQTTIAELARRFPNAFVAEDFQPHSPLAIGIREALIAACPDLSGAIPAALQRYTHRLMYQQSLVEGAARVDLMGAAAGTVSAQAAAYAAGRVAGILARRSAQATQAHKEPRTQAVPREAKPAAPIPTAKPKRPGLADLKAAALARRNAG